MLVVEGLDPVTELVILKADPGLAKETGEEEPGPGSGCSSEEGC